MNDKKAKNCYNYICGKVDIKRMKRSCKNGILGRKSLKMWLEAAGGGTRSHALSIFMQKKEGDKTLLSNTPPTYYTFYLSLSQTIA